MSWLSLIGCPSYAIQPPTPPKLPKLLYYFHKITQTGGLSSYNVERIMQDSYGYTWIATQDGLNRFDGKNISIYNKSVDPPRQLVNNDIWDLAEDTLNHRLWVLTYIGLNCIDLATGKVLDNPPAIGPAKNLPANSWFKCELLVGERLWIGSKNYNGLTVYNTRTQVFDSIQRLPEVSGPSAVPNVDRIWADEYGRIWVFVANYGIVIYSAETGRILERHLLAELGFEATMDFNRFRAVARIGPGRIALMTNTELYDLRYGEQGFRIKPFILPGEAALIPRKEMYWCATDPQGNLWFSADNALYRLNIISGGVARVEDADYSNPENWFNGVYDIYFDRVGHLWLGTLKGLAFSPDSPSPFSTFFQSADHRLAINHANYVFPYHDSLLYVCAEDGLYRVDLSSKLIHQLAAGRRFSSVTPLKDGHLLVGAEDTLYVLRGDTLAGVETVYKELRPISKEWICSVVWLGDTLAIMGGINAHGIFCWYPQRHILLPVNERTTPLALASDIVNGLCRDHRGRVWILSGTGWSIYDPSRQRIDTFHIDDPYRHLPATFYLDMVESQGLYWLAVYGTGLIGLDSNLHFRQIFSTREGLANNGLYKVFAWKDSLLIVTSNKGLSLIRPGDSSVVNYFQLDGLHGDGFEQGCGFYAGPYIYAGGERGISRIEPDRIPVDPLPPPLRIGNIRMQTADSVYDVGDLSTGILTVPSNVVQTSLTVATFDYTDEGRTTLSYGIPELKTQSIPLGPDRTIDLLGLPPGQYTLLIKAVNPNIFVRERRLVVKIRWLPKWYQTIWFDLAIALAALAIFYSFYLYRINTIRQQQVIRQNISSDLHDDIGSILHTIKVFTQLARRGPDTESWLSQIETSLAQAVVALRDMIWVLDDSQDTLYQFLERLRQFALPATIAGGMQLDVAAEGEVTRMLLKEEKRNLLLLAKESVNNSIKYARCSRIVVRISTSGNSLTLRIADDGVGFDPGQPVEGNGLKNIRRRATKIHYTVAIDSAPGAGTRITLHKP